MTDNGSQTRPVRTLTVKNFSVIKEATLEFGKITVLIGPQASGKSLLCKLAFFFGQLVPEIAHGTLLLRMPYRKFIETVKQEFIERFPADAWIGQQLRISYASDRYTLSVASEDARANLKFEFDSAFSEEYARWIATHLEEGSSSSAISSPRTGPSANDFPVKVGSSIYIPAGRAFFSTPNKGFASFSSKNLDWVTERFAPEINWEYSDRNESFLGLSDHHFLKEFSHNADRILGGKVIRKDGVLLFQLGENGRHLPFQLLSSGTLELLPLLNPLSQMVWNAVAHVGIGLSKPQHDPIFIEEPESSVFPKTQYELIRLFTWLSNETILNLPFVITTHSPYTLSAFNNLIEAGQAAREHPSLHDKVAEIIPEQYWIKEGDFRAYAIEDGKLISILNDSGFIEGNYLDQVSEVIGNEFDKLLRLEYDSTKAS